jgi:hypothetical protein
MLFTSFGGSAVMVAGMLALMHHYEPTTERVNDLIHNYKWFLPVVLIVPTVVGVILQNKFIKNSRDWNI